MQAMLTHQAAGVPVQIFPFYLGRDDIPQGMLQRDWVMQTMKPHLNGHDVSGVNVLPVRMHCQQCRNKMRFETALLVKQFHGAMGMVNHSLEIILICDHCRSEKGCSGSCEGCGERKSCANIHKVSLQKPDPKTLSVHAISLLEERMDVLVVYQSAS